jgi:hypothetical protein
MGKVFETDAIEVLGRENVRKWRRKFEVIKMIDKAVNLREKTMQIFRVVQHRKRLEEQ